MYPTDKFNRWQNCRLSLVSREGRGRVQHEATRPQSLKQRRARGPLEIWPDPRIRGPTARCRHARGSDEPSLNSFSPSPRTRWSSSISACSRWNRSISRSQTRRWAPLPERPSTARLAPAACARSWRASCSKPCSTCRARRGRRGRDLARGRRGHRTAALHLRRSRRRRGRERIVGRSRRAPPADAERIRFLTRGDRTGWLGW